MFQIFLIVYTLLACDAATESNNSSTIDYWDDLWDRIVGGHDAKLRQNPWHAHLYVKGKFKCGGSLITDGVHTNGSNLILTAGHCLTISNATIETLTVRLGTIKLYTGQEWSTRYIISHPSYKHETHNSQNDVGLIVLKKPVKFVPGRIWPVKLASCGSKPPYPAFCKATGFGAIGFGEEISTKLLEVRLPRQPVAECAKVFPYYQPAKEETAFCAGFIEGERDTCLGDSGGPYVCLHDDGYFHLYGVTSWGDGCAFKNKFGVYMNVARFTEWIYFVMGQMSVS